MIKGYIFDFGGTLDTAGCHWGQMLWHAYQRQQIPVSEEQFREAYVYAERTLGRTPIIQSDYSFHKTLEVKIRIEMEYLCTSGAWQADEAEFTRGHKAVLEDVYSKVVEVTSHSREVLSQLAASYPMVLVSNFYGNISHVLEEFHLSEFFKDIVESAVVGVRKPDHRIFLLGVEALGLKPEECIVVGDSFYKDIEPAKKAGCQAVWFKGEGWTEQQYDETLPDKIITDLNQLL
ncbi:MAG: HAD family hydrolase [Prevotella sp.]|uniref:HAD family hydrolase n=1 Tax=Prevotella sp. P3-122 TaxID=2024223 RepID=UPI000B962210|nr:HAD family hydrolase [Prevotella sp. P3-122]MCI6555637.1 HAD family hydrolase [Prevotella sp.]MCI7341001.1 HAD family hydrolase [Prevotella sp.]MDD6670730.1 HAD family hydrolase [Prevotella sp.]MDD6753342.1 HAD family hydrolase [Prevotella sp.]MDY3271956.1 HAD family hydrolase [Prevotella sp.]